MDMKQVVQRLTQPLPAEIVACLRRALDEDVGTGDVTTNTIVPVDAPLSAQIIAKQRGVIAGLDIAENVFLLLDEQVRFQAHTNRRIVCRDWLCRR